jgi:exosortase A-associated hydrolase 2
VSTAEAAADAATGLRALHLPSATGREGDGGLFVILHEPPPAATRRGAVLHFPAFAEEMNKSRHMVAAAARAMASGGWQVLVPDWFGTGDSPGEWSEASWERWRADASACLRWLHAQAAGAPLTLWGHRAGALLAMQTLADDPLAHGAELLFWHPVVAGHQHIQQFLRLKLAAGLGEAGVARARGASLRAELAAGGVVEIAGYGLTQAVASGLQAVELAPSAGAAATRLAWIELASRSPTALLPASERAIRSFREAGWRVQARALEGPAFWQTVEIESAPALLAASIEALGADDRVPT